jgi:hypothetical protein
MQVIAYVDGIQARTLLISGGTLCAFKKER